METKHILRSSIGLRQAGLGSNKHLAYSYLLNWLGTEKDYLCLNMCKLLYINACYVWLVLILIDVCVSWTTKLESLLACSQAIFWVSDYEREQSLGYFRLLIRNQVKAFRYNYMQRLEQNYVFKFNLGIGCLKRYFNVNCVVS